MTVFDDWYTLAHCWYSLGRRVTIGAPMLLSVFDDWYNVPFVKNSQKTVKTAKMTIGVPIVTCLLRLYQQCTKNVPIVKNSQKQSKGSQNSKNEELKLRG